MKILSCTPAYGCDYKTKKDVLEAWNDGKDFIAQPSTLYFSKEEIPFLLNDNITQIKFNYNKNTMSFLYNLG